MECDLSIQSHRVLFSQSKRRYLVCIEMVMIGFYLEDELRYCPQHWQNFIRTNQKDIWSDISIRSINRLLRPYRARYVEADYLDQDKVIFEDEKGLTWFIVRWS